MKNLSSVGRPFRLSRREWLVAAGSAWLAPVSAAQQAGCQIIQLSDENAERFLKEAKIVQTRNIGVGIAHTVRCTLRDETMAHDAHMANIDESKAQFQTIRGTEINFRDCWKFNCAAYRLDRMLDLQMCPVSIPRKVAGKEGSLSWWVDCARMEGERLKAKQEPPDADKWARQIHMMRVFDQLIFNTDRNAQNMLITPDWRLWLIDHTRAFRRFTDLGEPKSLTRCERRLLSGMESLTAARLDTNCGEWLDSLQLKGLLARRDKLVALFRKRIADLGEEKVLYDFVRT